MMRQFAIGDIHGCSIALERIDRDLRFGPDDLVVTLGDYVDRGPDSKGVIDYLIGLRSRCRLITLRGNHEIMMIRAREDRSALMEWMSCGGDATLESYGCRTFDDIPASHWSFLERTVSYHEEDRNFYVHANAYPQFSLPEQPDYMLFWEFFGDPSPHQSGRRMICGHTAQKSGKPKNVGHAVCIDTHAHAGGWLTCMESRTGLYWQANQKNDCRASQLDW